ncbi:ribose ABC transporter permease, partial [Nitrosarchaeum koreense]|nr:ribose ABC transporter permease [Nitrosarchaeum koreense]
MIKRKLLGQHFLNSQNIAKSIVTEAKITKKDTVFELGTGLGILTPL